MIIAADDIDILINYINTDPVEQINFTWTGVFSECPDECRNFSRDDAHLLRFGRKFRKLFRLHDETLPGVWLFAGVVSADAATGAMFQGIFTPSGAGMDLRSALMSCLGEGAECVFGSLNARDQPIFVDDRGRGLSEKTRAFLQWSAPETPVSAIPFHRFAEVDTGEPSLLPEDVSLWNPRPNRSLRVDWPLSVGLGVGLAQEDALAHAMLELVERDSIAQWWYGDLQGKSLPSLNEYALRLLHAARGKFFSSRPTLIMSITTELKVPTVVAVSCDSVGRRVCTGFATKFTMRKAVAAALTELFQLEMGVKNSLSRFEAGMELTKEEKSNISKFNDFDIRVNSKLIPLQEGESADLVSDGIRKNLEHVKRNLNKENIKIFALDRNTDLAGLFAVKCFSWDLQILPDGPRTDRLRLAEVRAGQQGQTQVRSAIM